MKHPTTRRIAAAATAMLVSGGVLLTPSAADAAKPKPLTGKISATVPMTCMIFTTEFAYDAKVTLKATRATKTAKAVALAATMSDMPGTAPLALDYDTTTKLSLKVASASATLKGKGHIDVGPQEPTPMAPAKGSAKVKGSSLAVSVKKLDLTVLTDDGAELTTIPCVPSASASLGKLRLK